MVAGTAKANPHPQSLSLLVIATWRQCLQQTRLYSVGWSAYRRTHRCTRESLTLSKALLPLLPAPPPSRAGWPPWIRASQVHRTGANRIRSDLVSLKSQTSSARLQRPMVWFCLPTAPGRRGDTRTRENRYQACQHPSAQTPSSRSYPWPDQTEVIPHTTLRTTITTTNMYPIFRLSIFRAPFLGRISTTSTTRRRPRLPSWLPRGVATVFRLRAVTIIETVLRCKTSTPAAMVSALTAPCPHPMRIQVAPWPKAIDPASTTSGVCTLSEPPRQFKERFKRRRNMRRSQ